jgi:hypothetical protein
VLGHGHVEVEAERHHDGHRCGQLHPHGLNVTQ